MISKRYGRIVNVSALGAVRGIDVDPTYTAAKAGLLGFTKSIARYLGKYNITVNAVSPGPIDTELSRKQLPKEMVAGIARSSPWVVLALRMKSLMPYCSLLRTIHGMSLVR